MMIRLRPLLVPAIFTLVVGTILIGLGVWQLHRLTWKEAIIARIESRTKAKPQPLPLRTTWSHLAPADYEYRRVSLDGIFHNDQETLVFRGSADDGPGYLVLTPLALQGGGTVLVNRGFVPDDLKDKATRAAGQPSGQVHVTGLMRQPEPRNIFTPGDEPAKNQFFTRDPKLIAAYLGLSDAAPFTVDADATPNPGGWPRGGATELVIPNNHFSYALTWFGLALGLFGVFFSFAFRRLAEERSRGAAAAVAQMR
jgi:surfeit locus 1 family protein